MQSLIDEFENMVAVLKEKQNWRVLSGLNKHVPIHTNVHKMHS